MKRVFTLLLVICMAVFLFAGCGGSSGGGSAASDTAAGGSSAGDSAAAEATETPADSGETWDLIWVQQSPATSLDGGVFQEAFQKWLWAESGGRIRIVDLSAGALVPTGNELDAIASNQAQIGFVENQFESGNIVVNQACNIPLEWGWPAATQAALVYDALYKEFPEMQEELASQGLKYLAGIFGAPAQFQTTNKPVHSMEDLKGLNMCELGTYASESAKLLGMVPLSLSTTERVDALAKGVADGVEVNYNAAGGFYFDSINYSTHVSLVSPNVQWLVMNPETYDSFPDDIKAIFSDENMAKVLKVYNYLRDSFDMVGRENLVNKYAENGLPEIFIMPDDEMVKIREAVAPVKEIWIQDCRDHGYGDIGVDIQARLAEIIDDYAWTDALEAECVSLLEDWQSLPDVPEK